jgi:hypothetical protein
VNNQDGVVSNKLFHLYVEERRKFELQQSRSAATDLSSGSSILPRSSDVLLGRGRPYQEFPGNVRFSHLIDEFLEEYAGGSKRVKTQTIDRVMDRVKETWGGQFLKKTGKENGDWTEANPADSREKVSHVFRAKLRRRGGSSAMRIITSCRTTASL